MQQERTLGLVLRVRPWSDTSLIVHWLTPGLGRIATVAKGARQPKSPLSGRLELHQIVDFAFRRARSGDLHTLVEAVVSESFGRLRTDYGLLCQAAYASAFVEQMTETETPVDEVYALCVDWLRHCASRPPRPRNVHAFELRFLDALGLLPDWASEGAGESEQALAEILTRGSWDEVESLTPPPAAVVALRRRLQGFIQHHCGRLPRGRSEALAAGSPVERRSRPE